MKKYFRFGILLIIVSAVAFGVHCLVFWTIWNIASFSEPDNAFLASGVVVGSLVVLLIFFKICSVTLWCIHMYITNVWAGLLLNAFLTSILYHIITIFYVPSPFIGFAIVIGIACALTMYGLINATCIQIDRINIRVPGFKGQTTIAHLSDLHLGAIYQRNFVQKVVDIVQQLNPDTVVITGDLADGNLDITPDMLSPFNDLQVKILYVLGNHEEIAGVSHVLSVVRKTNIKHLQDDQIEHNGVRFIGIDYGKGKEFLANKLRKIGIERGQTNVLLFHVPVMKAHELEKYGIVLHLAGHTHGGQILPFHPFVWLANAYFSGLYESQSGNCRVYVSSGIGTAGPPMKIFARSVIGLITITG